MYCYTALLATNNTLKLLNYSCYYKERRAHKSFLHSHLLKLVFKNPFSYNLFIFIPLKKIGKIPIFFKTYFYLISTTFFLQLYCPSRKCLFFAFSRVCDIFILQLQLHLLHFACKLFPALGIQHLLSTTGASFSLPSPTPPHTFHFRLLADIMDEVQAHIINGLNATLIREK